MKNNSFIDVFGNLVHVFDDNSGGDYGSSFPKSDADDLSYGLRFIPGEVTMARRRGERVTFIQSCKNVCCWYWQFKDGSRTYYWERWNFEQIAQENGVNQEQGAGPCPNCGNPHTSGGHIEKP